MPTAKHKPPADELSLGDFDDDAPDDWRSRLILSPRGTDPRGNLANALTALRSAPQWVGVLGRDTFAHRTVALRPPLWEAGSNNWSEREWLPRDDVQATEWLQRNGVPVGVEITQQAIEAAGHDRAFHPVEDYLNSLAWDGQPRVESWLTGYLGAEKSAYAGAAGQCSLIAAVARILRPGCKVDTVPILEGNQGAGKSSALRVLGGRWFTDEIAELGSKDAAMQIEGAWLIEISELDAMGKAEVSRIKAFISRTTDRFRPAFGRRVIESPRQCVFWGTTNGETYLKDETGGRRFWPIRTGRIRLDTLERDRDQLFAEAVALFKRGEPWWFRSASLEGEAATQQSGRFNSDPWEERIAEYVADEEFVTVAEVLEDALHLPVSHRTQVHQNRAARCLTTLGFNRVQRRTGDKRLWGYQRTGDR
jgi:predicted P-loop ATPase